MWAKETRVSVVRRITMHDAGKEGYTLETGGNVRRWVVPVAAIALPLCLIAELLLIRWYSTADGLASDRIDKIVTDSRSFIWFCTPEGLSRFDGYRFKNFGVAEGLPNRSVNTLLETRSGEFLVGTDGGLCGFRPGGSGKFTTYLPGKQVVHRGSGTAAAADGASRAAYRSHTGSANRAEGHRFKDGKNAAPPARPASHPLAVAATENGRLAGTGAGTRLGAVHAMLLAAGPSNGGTKGPGRRGSPHGRSPFPSFAFRQRRQLPFECALGR